MHISFSYRQRNVFRYINRIVYHHQVLYTTGVSSSSTVISIFHQDRSWRFRKYTISLILKYSAPQFKFQIVEIFCATKGICILFLYFYRQFYNITWYLFTVVISKQMPRECSTAEHRIMLQYNTFYHFSYPMHVAYHYLHH